MNALNLTHLRNGFVDTNGYDNADPLGRIVAAAQVAKDYNPQATALAPSAPQDSFVATTANSSVAPPDSTAITPAPVPQENGFVKFMKSPLGLVLGVAGVAGAGFVGYNTFFNSPIKQLQRHVAQLTGEKASDVNHLNQHLPHFGNALNSLTYGGREHKLETWIHISSAIADVHQVHGDKLPVAHLLLNNVHAHPSKLESQGLVAMQSASSKVISHFAESKQPLNTASSHALFEKSLAWSLHGKDISTLTKDEAERILKAYENAKTANAPIPDAITRIQAHLQSLSTQGKPTKTRGTGNIFKRMGDGVKGTRKALAEEWKVLSGMKKLSLISKLSALGLLGVLTHGSLIGFFGLDAVTPVVSHVVPPTLAFGGELLSATKKLFGSLFAGVKLPLPRICPLP